MKKLLAVLSLLVVSAVAVRGDAASIMYAIDRASDSLYTINPANGDTTLVGAAGFDISYSGLSWGGGKMYASDLSSNGWSLATINLNTGAATIIGQQNFVNLMALAHVGGTLYGFESDAGLGTVNTTT